MSENKKLQQFMKNRSTSTLSLPKIHELPEEDQKVLQAAITKKTKLLSQIFKPKWGMAPKCLVKGHQGKQILYLCINKQCQQTTRLVCQQCFQGNHSHHNMQCLAIDEIKNGKIQKLKHWPFAEEFKKMFEFVTKHQSYVNNVVQDVNATFNEMALRIMNEIDKMRLNMLKKIDTFYIKETIKKQFAQNLKSQLQQTFDLKKIQKTVSDLFNKKIRHSVFQNQISELLNDKQMAVKQRKLLAFYDKSQKGVDIKFDKQVFLKKEKLIIQGIEQQQACLKSVDVVIGDVKQMQKIIPQALKYLSVQMNNFKQLKFERKILEDTSQYVGFICKGAKNLIGLRKYKNGYVYYGQWLNDTRNGWGILESKASGYKYVGNWKQDRKNGFGRQETFVTIYQGEFVQDKKQGFGVLIKDGNRHQINWKNDKMHGEGKVIQSDGIEHPIYYFNGLETQTKKQKIAGDGAMSLTELAKRFSKSTKTKSIISQTKST